MEVDEESNEINQVFEQLSQSTSSQHSSQRPFVAPAIPQSNVGNRRHRREKAEKEGQKIAAEPGFGAPLNIQKQKRTILDGLRHILSHKNKAIPSKKDAFSDTPLDRIDEVADYLELSETGELLRFSSMVYALRVDTTYNDAMSTNVQLQPSRMKSEDMSKKSKAEQKLQQTTATQSLNLQKLQFEMEQDAPEEDEDATPSLDGQQKGAENGAAAGEQEEQGDEGAEGEAGAADDEDEEAREAREAELTEEERARLKDTRPLDTDKLAYSNTAIKDIIAEECKRRQRNLDRKCDSNPMLMDDERKYRMAPAALLTNEYYQIATSRYKELNASGMLAYNCKVTHNGRVTLMHKRMDSWKDAEAQDLTPPTKPFRKALAGLVDNAMRDADSLQILPNYLFDPADVSAQTSKLTTGLELADIEKKTREKILQQSDFDFLDDDDHVIREDGDGSEASASPPSQRRSIGREQEGEGSQSGASRANSVNPSTPTAETETSEASAKMTPRASKSATEKEAEDMGMSQAELDEYMEVMSAAPRKRKFRKTKALTAVMSEDEIKNGPKLTMDGLVAKFRQILAKKCSMGSTVEWKRGANSEELQADAATIAEETLHVERGSTDMDLMHLDKLWTSKYYTKTFTAAEVRDIKENMRQVMSDGDVKRKLLYFKPGEYEFIGEDDEWRNPDVEPDEYVPMEDEEQPLVRQLEDSTELERLERAIERAEEDSDEDDGGGVADEEDERIVVQADDDAGGAGNDPIDDFFMSDIDDENPSSSTTGEKRTDFTAGDDQRLGEMGDVNGMFDPTFVSDVRPSEAVVAMGKKDDSHWKGGKDETEKPKKERKKRKEEEEAAQRSTWFDCEGDIICKKKLYRTRFPQITKNTELMKETDQLIMPEQVNIVPQEEYDPTLFFKSFFCPSELLPNYVERRAGSGSDEENGIVSVDSDARLEHYSAMLDSSLGWARQDGEDVFLSFLRTFRHFPDVATQQEIDMEERERTGEADSEQAATSQNGQVDASFGGLDDLDDFGGDAGGGMDDIEDSGGAGDDALPTSTTGLSEGTGLKSTRAVSQARSIALASTHGYGMRVENSEDGDDEADAYAKMGDREYHLRLIKLDTVAMKTALSDVLTNPMMVAEKLDETLGHFNRVLATQMIDDVRREKRTKANLQTINEDEEMEVEPRSLADDSFESAADSRNPQEIIDETLMELPDAMNVTRALFAPVKEKVKPEKTVAFGRGAISSQNQTQAKHEHIELQGHHTLKSTFTCLPARMPMKATSDVTVASTISMILHMANEHNLILEQHGPNEGAAEGGSTSTHGDWMNDFEVQCLDDADGSKIASVSKRISNAVEVLQQLSADEDASDAEKRQKETEKVLAEMAAKQRADAEEEERKRAREERQRKMEEARLLLEERKKKKGGAARRSNGEVSSTDDVVDVSDDSDVVEVNDDEIFFKAPAAPKRATPIKAGDGQSGDGPSTKRARTRPAPAGQMDETICLDD